MAGYFRLQDLFKASGSEVQDKRDAIDIGAYRHVVVQVRVPVNASTAGTLYLQHAAVREDEAFLDYDPNNVSVDLAVDTNVTLLVTDGLRFLRWRTASVSTEAKFLIDSIGR